MSAYPTSPRRQVPSKQAERYRRDHPEEAARIDALFAPLHGLLAAMHEELRNIDDTTKGLA